MKTLIKISIYLFALEFILSCGCKELYFDKNETFWTDVYNKGDITIFQSNQNPLYKDTIFILEKTYLQTNWRM
jgi:hypothetical protein